MMVIDGYLSFPSLPTSFPDGAKNTELLEQAIFAV